VKNLWITHHPQFMQYYHMDAGVAVAFAGANGLKILASSRYIIVDGTFDLVKDELVLTTLMGYHDDVAIPAAYLVSKHKTQPVYQTFFQVCH
jgi:hypothetical protein